MNQITTTELINDSNDSSVLNRQIYQYLLNKIITMELKPGDKINTAQLSDELKISRTPIRSALDKLIEEKLVNQINDRSFQVTPISMSDCFALCDARKIIEGAAAYLAASTITNKDLEILEKSVEDGKLATATFNYDDFAQSDQVFHETLLSAANNRYLIMANNSIATKINRYRYLINEYCRKNAKEDTSHALAKHTCILKAVKNRYSSIAKTEMEEHISYTYKTLFTLGQIIGNSIID